MDREFDHYALKTAHLFAPQPLESHRALIEDLFVAAVVDHLFNGISHLRSIRGGGVILTDFLCRDSRYCEAARTKLLLLSLI